MYGTTKQFGYIGLTRQCSTIRSWEQWIEKLHLGKSRIEGRWPITMRFTGRSRAESLDIKVMSLLTQIDFAGRRLHYVVSDSGTSG